MTAETHAAAIKARITEFTKTPTFDQDEAQRLSASLPASYVVIYLSSRNNDALTRLGGTSEPRGFRLSTEVNARDYVANARQLESGVLGALLLNPLALDGAPVDIRYETGGGDFERSGGYYTATTDWIYVR